jgi:hypothetical protein
MHTTRMVLSVAVLALATTAGCRRGMSAEKLPVANQPGGAQVLVRTSSAAYGGELLAVQDDGVIISNDRIMFIPFSAIAQLTVKELGREFQLVRGSVPRDEQLARFRAVSRFPQGLTPNIRSQLLAQKSQTEIAVVQ